jgi:excisionase family DNA binding protein
MEHLPKLTYSVREVCEILQISRTTLWKLTKAKKNGLKVLRIGRRVLFSVETIQDFLKGGGR